MGLPGRQGSVRLMNFEPIFVDSQSHDFCVTGSFKIATICDSVNLDFLVRSRVPGESTVCLESEPGGAYDFDTATPLPRDQSSKPEVMSRRTKTSSRAIPGEAASLSERRAMKSAFSPRRRASDSMLMITKSPERDPLIPK
jgi:hypothetical protein